MRIVAGSFGEMDRDNRDEGHVGETGSTAQYA